MPDLRITDFNKRHHSDGTQCWICGEPLGEHKAFLISEDVVKTRVHDEPPSHRDCAIFAAKACPFIVNPQMRRNRKDMPLAVDARSGHPAKYCVWVTNKFAIENRGGRRFWRHRLTWIYGNERVRRRWRDRSVPPRGRHRGRYQAPTHLIIPHDGQQTTMQDDELRAYGRGQVNVEYGPRPRGRDFEPTYIRSNKSNP